MKKLFVMLMTAALLMPVASQAQTYWYRDDDGYRYTRYSNIYQYQVRISNDRLELSRAQDVLARDRALGRWWAISGDVIRVREARARLDMDLAAFDAHRAMTPRTYRYYRY
ncbi:MAG: hypothetical protein ACAH83_03840 [Alphaproteobacteria bacterium]